MGKGIRGGGLCTAWEYRDGAELKSNAIRGKPVLCEKENEMNVTVRIPTQLQTLTDGADLVGVSGANVQAVIDALEAKFPGMKERLVDDKGVRRFVNLYLGDEDIRFLDGLQTPLTEGAELSIVPVIGGNTPRSFS